MQTESPKTVLHQGRWTQKKNDVRPGDDAVPFERQRSAHAERAEGGRSDMLSVITRMLRNRGLDGIRAERPIFVHSTQS